jgi:hypothetical protein
MSKLGSKTPDGRTVHTEGYRRFGEAPSKTPFGLIAHLPKEYQARAEKVLEAEGRLPKRTVELRARNPAHDYSRDRKDVLGETSARVADYADLSVTERIAEINERAGATNTKGEGAGQSTYEPPRTAAATVSDAAHVLRTHGTELAVGPRQRWESRRPVAAVVASPDPLSQRGLHRNLSHSRAPPFLSTAGFKYYILY